MSPERQRIAIAEFCGWTPWKTVSPIDRATPITLFEDGSGKVITELPDYITDLNAMHEAAMQLRLTSPLKYVKYHCAINAIVKAFNDGREDQLSISAHDATAAQRAEAFLRTIGKWEE